MNRRQFLKTSVAAGIVLGVPGGLNLLLPGAKATDIPDLAVVQASSPNRAVEAAIQTLGGISRFISRGDIVVIKPNIGWDRTPEYAANTNPEVVAAIVKLCFAAGAKKVKVFDRPCVDPRRSYKQSGIADAAQSIGADVLFMDDRRFKDMALSGHAYQSWPLYQDVFEADKVINVPIAKHHGRAGLTLGMKNWMGIMGGTRGKMHANLEEGLVDISMKVKPTLTILDAIRILTANGPQGGNLQDVKKLDTIVAGIDQVAVDAYGASLFGREASSIGYIHAAFKAGLGKMDLAKMKINKIAI